MKLYLQNGPNAGSSWELTAPGINIGRENDNDIQILVGGVSRYHAKITPQNGQWLLEDLGSTNGTKRNDTLIRGPVVLQEGDRLLIGEQEFLVAASSGEAEKAAPNIRISPATPKSTPSPAIPKTAPEEKASQVISPPPSAEMEKKNFTSSIAPLGDIFKKSSSGSSGSESSDGEKPKKFMSNLVFTVLVIALAAIALAIFLKLNEPQKIQPRPKAAKQLENTFTALYEKQEIRNDAIFRFFMLLEGDKVIFSVDEHKAKENVSYKYASTPIVVAKEKLERLRKELKNTSFMNLKAEPHAPGSRGEDKYLKITLVLGNEFNSISVRNTYPQKSFSETASILESFIEDFSGIRTVSMSVEEMRNEAEKSFRIAQDLFENYQAKPQNLRDCIARFNLTVNLLERFQPRPALWQEAKERGDKARKILNNIIKSTYDDMMIQYRLNNKRGCLEKARILLDYMNPENKNYEKIRNFKIALERDVSRLKGRK